MQNRALPTMAKIQIIGLFFIFINITAYGQYKNNLSLVYGTGSNIFGSPNYITETFNMVGANYTCKISNWLYFESGLEYYYNNLGYSDPGVSLYNTGNYSQSGSQSVIKGSITTVSIPVYANFVFLKYLYADFGLIANFESFNTPYPVSQKPNFLGFGLGLGGKYPLNDYITVFVNPFFKADISEKAVANYGFKVGLGYTF